MKKPRKLFFPLSGFLFLLFPIFLFPRDLLSAKACRADQARTKQEHGTWFGKRRKVWASPNDNCHGSRGQQKHCHQNYHCANPYQFLHPSSFPFYVRALKLDCGGNSFCSSPPQADVS
jgi:hypothetical protein